jgi:hypothetical protein
LRSASGERLRIDASNDGSGRKPEASPCGEWEVLDAPTQAGVGDSVILRQPLAGELRESESDSGEPRESTELEEDDGEEEAEGWDEARREA